MKQPIHPYTVYDSKEAAELLGVDQTTIQRYIRNGKLIATLLGKVYRISGQSLLDLMSLDSESVKVSQDRVRQVENANYIKSKSYLLSNPKGLQYFNLFDLIINVLFSVLNPFHEGLSEDELTLRYIGSRAFNSAMAAYRDTLSGYYQVSYANQRDLLEIQFLIDYFRTFPAKIKEWREANNAQRIENFSPGKIRQALDERDGFNDRRREARYKQFCEYATHVSYPGLKLLINQDNKVEIGPFYDEGKLMNTMYELCLTFGHATTSLSANINIRDVKTTGLMIKLMKEFDNVFQFKITETETFKAHETEINKIIKKMTESHI